MDNPIFEILKNLFAGGQNNFSSNNFVSQDKSANFSQTQNRAFDYYPKEAFNWQNQSCQNSNYNENLQNNQQANQQNNSDQNQGFNLNSILPMLMSLSKSGNLSGLLEALSTKKQPFKSPSTENKEKGEDRAPNEEILL